MYHGAKCSDCVITNQLLEMLLSEIKSSKLKFLNVESRETWLILAENSYWKIRRDPLTNPLQLIPPCVLQEWNFKGTCAICLLWIFWIHKSNKLHNRPNHYHLLEKNIVPSGLCDRRKFRIDYHMLTDYTDVLYIGHLEGLIYWFQVWVFAVL
jgi:hypothetical protein